MDACGERSCCLSPPQARSSADKPPFGTSRRRPNFFDRLAQEHGHRDFEAFHTFRPRSWGQAALGTKTDTRQDPVLVGRAELELDVLAAMRRQPVVEGL